MCVTCLQSHPRSAQVGRVGLFGESLQLGAVQRGQQLPRLLQPLPLLGEDVATATAAAASSAAAAAVGVVEQGGPSAVQVEEGGVVSQRKPLPIAQCERTLALLQVVQRLGERRALLLRRL